jgi:hypothetical protein
MDDNNNLIEDGYINENLQQYESSLEKFKGILNKILFILYTCKTFIKREMIDNFFYLSFEQILFLKFSLLVQN